MLVVDATAKINLALEVLGRRQDGYHEIRTVMQAIDLHDTLRFHPGTGLSVVSSRLLTLDNTVAAAARLFGGKLGYTGGATIELVKRIPAAAGLGGGSSDGAATLTGLNRLWQRGLSREELLPLAEKLGSDVPFFLYGGTALAEGRGERITSLPLLPPRTIVLLVPPVAVPMGKTGRLYRSLQASHHTRGEFTERAVKAIRHGRLPELHNVFENVAFDVFPGLRGFWQRFEASGAGEVHLAGSGPVLFSLCGTENEADEVCLKLRRQGLEAHLAHTTGPLTLREASGPV